MNGAEQPFGLSPAASDVLVCYTCRPMPIISSAKSASAIQILMTRASGMLSMAKRRPARSRPKESSESAFIMTSLSRNSLADCHWDKIGKDRLGES